MVFKFDDFLDCFVSGARYIPVTLLAVVIAMVAGLIFGTVFALLRSAKIPVLSQAIGIFFSVLRGIPSILVFIIVRLVYTTQFANIMSSLGLHISIRDVSPAVPGVIALFIVVFPILSEAVRGTLLSVGRDQYDAGYSVGLSFAQIFRRVALPQLIPVAIPVLMNNFIITLKISALMFMIGVMDVYNGAQIPAHKTYGYFEAYVAAGAIYWLIFIVAEQIGKRLEKRASLYKSSDRKVVRHSA